MFFWIRRLRLAKRRTVWWPTWLGSLCIAALLVVPLAWWCIYGESILSLDRRISADVLVVEGWIGLNALNAAAQEIEQHGYQYVVVTGGPTSQRWAERQWNYADMATKELIRLGIPKDKIIPAPAQDSERQRTFASAVAALQALQAKGILPSSLDLFTFGPHAKRSQLVFAKLFGPRTNIGVISWTPPEYRTESWWHSSERARELLSESAGYLFEVIFNSGRRSNSLTGR